MHMVAPPIRDVVLVGGGHSHVQVLRSFGMKPQPGARLTIISREVRTPYSGMLPGHVAGYYQRDDIHIDLGPLAAFAGARLIADEVVGLDTDAQRLQLQSHPDLHYDLLSINSGAVPVGVGDHGIAVKPIGQFLPKLDEVCGHTSPGETIAVVGGGAGGVELTLALRRRLGSEVRLLLATDELLVGHAQAARRRLTHALQRSDVEVVTGFRAHTADARGIVANDGARLEAEHVFWVTGVSAPSWPAAAGLATDSDGFIKVDRRLRSVSHGQIFAAGDVACLVEQPRPKSGVYAVREGPTLTANLRRAVAGKRLRTFRAQRRFLSLIGTGDGRAVASKGPWVASGRWAWHWKDWIDRRFMRRFTELPQMPAPEWELPSNLEVLAPSAMRCGGCGAKLGADPLRRVLERLPPQPGDQVLLGIGDDAAVISNQGPATVLTVDGFRSLVSDPYLFGRITAHHALNDVFAMGGRGIAALALATVPLMAENLMEEDLYQLLRGAVDVLNAHGVALVGGHSAEGAELSLGLTVTGAVVEPMLTKADLTSGEALVLTKGLGTGVLMAANMQGHANSHWTQAAFRSMDTSNGQAVEILRKHGVRAATDISGFGLLGHLSEMLRASNVSAKLVLECVPLLAGAKQCMASGMASALQQNNELALLDYELIGVAPTDAALRLMVDPQTSGGLLASVPGANAQECVVELHAAGFSDAAVVGQVGELEAGNRVQCE